MPSRRPTRDGFTLVEVIIVISLLALIAAVIAGTITVIVRNATANETRVDDARVVQGLVTWLPQDVDSTTPNGFDLSPTKISGCSGASPGASLLHLSWSEFDGSVTNSFVANYRFVADSSGSRVDRYTCTNGGTARIVAAARNLMALPGGWTPGSAPAKVSATTDLDGKLDQVVFELTTATGKVVRVDASPKNPSETLPTTTLPATSTTSTTTTTTSTTSTTTTSTTTTTTTVPGATTTTTLSPPTTTTTTTTTTTLPPTTTVPCVVSSLTTDASGGKVRLRSGSGPNLLATNVVVRAVWSGGCSGLYLAYTSGGTGALLSQNFGTTSPTTVTLVGYPAGSEYWTTGDKILVAKDANNQTTGYRSVTLTVNACNAQNGCSN